MPRIADKILNCVVYVYPDEDSARLRVNAGGSGFVVGVPSKTIMGKGYVYIVTNAHVVNGQDSYITVNNRDGGFDIIRVLAHQWKHHADGDDLVVAPVNVFNEKRHQLDYYITTDEFITKEEMKKEDIGIGDDIFIVGRFQAADGKLQNTPALRLGNIAQMPIEPIESPHGIKQESFLVECHSISGFSGSPVFVRIDGMSARPNNPNISTTTNHYLIGIDWGHLFINEPVLLKVRTENKWVKSEDLVVLNNSAMMGVVPVWKLQDLLNDDDLVAIRDEFDKNHPENITNETPRPPSAPQDNIGTGKRSRKGFVA